MNLEDESFVRKCLAANAIHSPCLEIGVGFDGSSLRWLLEPAGIEYFGADMNDHKDADFVFDLEDDIDSIRTATHSHTFSSILILNVLEHTFEPIACLDKCFDLLPPSGACVIIAPAVWPLHDLPMDCYRLLPNFYEEYARRRGYRLNSDLFCYVGSNELVKNPTLPAHSFPSFSSMSKSRYWRSRLIHKLFNTFGRGIEFSNHLSIGAVIEKS